MRGGIFRAMTWHDRVAERLKAKGWDRPDLVKALLDVNVKVTLGRVHKWMQGDVVKPPHGAYLEALAFVLNVEPEWIVTGRNIDVEAALIRFGLSRVPLIKVDKLMALTKDIVRESNWRPDGEAETVPGQFGSRVFAMKVQDDSMAPRFNKDDLVIFDPDKGQAPLKFVLARVYKNGSDGLVLRQWHAVSAANSDIGELVALQRGYPPIPLNGEEDGFIIARAVRRFVADDVDE